MDNDVATQTLPTVSPLASAHIDTESQAADSFFASALHRTYHITGVFVWYWGWNPGLLCMLIKCSNTELHPPTSVGLLTQSAGVAVSGAEKTISWAIPKSSARTIPQGLLQPHCREASRALDIKGSPQWGLADCHIWTPYWCLQLPLLEARATVCCKDLHKLFTNSFLYILNLKPWTFTIALQTLLWRVEYSNAKGSHFIGIGRKRISIHSCKHPK